MNVNLEAKGGMNIDSGDRPFAQSFNHSITQSLNRSIVKSLASLAAAIGVPPEKAWKRIEICGITQDSRDVKPGYLFVAIKGFASDGNRFIDDAISRGAAAIVSSKHVSCHVPLLRVDGGRIALAGLSAAFFSHPTRGLFTVGVTGTNGKTTVCHLVSHLLGDHESVIVGTVSNEARGLHAVTTPESPIVQQIASDALASGKRNLILETSSAGLFLHRVDNVDFDAAVFTNLTHDHYDFHSDREGYLRAKLILFRDLKPTARAIVNADDPSSAQMIDSTRAKVVTYAIAEPASYRATNIEYELKSTRFTIEHGADRVPVRIALPGEHNVYNALAAAVVASEAGIPFPLIASRLATASSVAGRYEFLKAANGASVVVDFAHSPDSLKKMLLSLQPYYERIICVFGCGGESDRDKRPIMGRISSQLADVTILTTDNPKSENPREIINAIAEGVSPEAKCEHILDREEAIRRAIELANPNDVVLIAGKGHETYQIVGHEFVPHNDIQYMHNSGLVS
ncbi:UDP-N-acetylmuramoyl-L-alanyl-D-glutamate--2,6-diaminopimelate ligase [Candidatus Bipolaricaulota bacterium]|nr:UDP-N-acetylmuramoyl-L-alanyl-D-glutamate--2,6-diaminopimelate ligase [Candidatus Bipolaricaulota bacterium]